MVYDTEHLISQLKESGLTQKAFCEKNKIPVSTLYYHLRKQKKADAGSMRSTPTQKQFIPISFSGDSDSNSSCSIIIVKGNFSQDSLSTLIRSAVS